MTIDAPYALRIDKIDFGAWENGNNFQLFTDLVDPTRLFGPGIIPGPPGAFNPANPWFLLADNGINAIATANFAIKANGAGGREGFRVPSITFSAVPEPAPLALLMAGLLMVSVRLRRGKGR